MSADFVQAAFSGFALGCRYGLIALAFVVVFKATRVINFAQPALALVGAYLTFTLANQADWPFWPALVAATVGGAAVGVALERAVFRHLIGRPPAIIAVASLGVLFVLDNLVTAIWGPERQTLGDPWGISTLSVGSVALPVRDLWTIALAGVAFACVFAYFQFTRLGLAMRASSSDQEAATANGIERTTVYQIAFGMAGALGVIAGVSLAAGSSGLSPSTGLFALAAFPAMILGGLNSPGGAIVGGVLIGLVQQLTSFYSEHLQWAGPSVDQVTPYLAMVLVLLTRPYGLFGTPEGRKV